MAPKKKAQKLALGDFLADDSIGGSWADEMASLPTAPAPRDSNADPSSFGNSYSSRNNRYGDRGGDKAGGYGDRMDRGGFDQDRPPRVELPVPDRPPFNAFIGNLSYDVAASDLESFFGGKPIVSSVRMISDNVTGKPKGYCYVEFADRDGLVAALEKSGREIGGRTIRVSVAEPPKEREDRTAGAWRREGPLPSQDDRRRPPSGNFRDRDNRDRDHVLDEDRGERFGFGAKFVASSDGPERSGGFRRPSERSYGGSSNANAVLDEDRGERFGFGSKFVPSDPPEASSRRPSGAPSNYGDRSFPQRGSAFVPSVDGPPNSGTSTNSRQGQGDRRASEAPSAADSAASWRNARPPVSRNGSISPAETQPVGRKKLELASRTVSSTSTPAGSGAASPTSIASKPSPFGGARPVDSSERERIVEEKMTREREERVAKVEAEKKAKAEAEEARKAARANAPNPFGDAKPVDTQAKELAVSERLEAERKELADKVAQVQQHAAAAKAAGPVPTASTMSSGDDSKNAAAPTSPRSPTIETAPASIASATGPMTAGTTTTTKSPAASATGPPPPAQKGPKAADSALRKQGLSFAERAKAKSSSGPAPGVKPETPITVDDLTKKLDTVQVGGQD